MQIGVSVNISAASLRDDELPDKIGVMPHEAWHPARVTLEITEDCFIADPVQAMLILERVRGLGVELSIDDFGTGFSSLTYIRRLPVTELKLDRTFLTGRRRDERAVSVIRSTVELAHSLGSAHRRGGHRKPRGARAGRQPRLRRRTGVSHGPAGVVRGLRPRTCRAATASRRAGDRRPWTAPEIVRRLSLQALTGEAVR